MSTFIWLLAWLFFLGYLAYLKASLKQATIAIATTLILTLYFSQLSFASFCLLALLFGGIASILNSPTRRKKYCSAYLLRLFRKMQPKISETERIALDAGSTWWDYALFSGDPNYQDLLVKLPAAKLSEAEKAFLEGPVETLCEQINDWEINQTGDFSPEIWDFLKQNRFFGLIIPKTYGGLAFSAYAHSEILKKLASKNLAIATTVSVPNSLGPAELILHYGTLAQKKRYLKKLAQGEEIPCFALTAPQAGSDATAITDAGTVCYQTFEGKKTLGIELNWDKRYITLAPIATVLGLAFKLFDPNKLLGEETQLGITCALIPTHLPGITIGKRHNPLNCAFQNGPTQGDHVFIPIDWIIGGREGIGLGWKMLVERLAVGRAISLPALATGAAKLACATSGAYARIRTQFRHPIGHFEGVEAVLAKMAGKLYIIESAQTVTTCAIDAGEQPSVISAIVKYHVTQFSREIITHAMDLHAGKAIMMGPHNYLASYFQASPIPITVEGANILTRNMIIFGQGIIQSHPHLKKLLNTLNLKREQNALNRFDKQFRTYLRFSLNNLARTAFFAITRGYFISAPTQGKTKRYFQHITWGSSVLACVSDLALLFFGGKLKSKEKISARLGDLLSMLYLSSCCLKQFENQGRKTEDLPLVCWSLEMLLSQYWNQLEALLNNFPKPFRHCLKFFLMPLGKPVVPPQDALDKSLAKILLTPSQIRDRLLAGTYLNNTEHHPAGYMESVLTKIIEAEPLEKRIHKAIQEGVLIESDYLACLKKALKLTLITQAEAKILEEVYQARMAVISVDVFEAKNFSTKKTELLSKVG